MNQSQSDRIKALTELPENWDSYGAHPATQAAAEQIRALLILIGQVPGISPTVEGGITVEWRAHMTDWTLIL